MRDPRIQTRRLAVTHGLTHGDKVLKLQGLMLVRDSVSQDSHSIHKEENNMCMRVAHACPRAYARVRTRMCKGLESDSPDSQTHARVTPHRTLPPVPGHPLAHVAFVAPGWPTAQRSDQRATVRLARGARVPEWQSGCGAEWLWGCPPVPWFLPAAHSQPTPVGTVAESI